MSTRYNHIDIGNTEMERVDRFLDILERLAKSAERFVDLTERGVDSLGQFDVMITEATETEGDKDEH